jgi:hypothetical protein
LKADLAEAKAEKAKLEEQIKKLHRLRMELDVMYEDEKTRLIKQQERDRETVRLIIKRKCLFFTNTSRLALFPPTYSAIITGGCTKFKVTNFV